VSVLPLLLIADFFTKMDKIFSVLPFSLKICVLSGFCPFTCLERGRQNEHPFSEKIFSAENKKAENPPIYEHFRLKKIFENFLI
jgi:hypothetical protein